MTITVGKGSAAGSMTASANRLAVDWADIGRFAEALTFARKELFAPTQAIRKRHGLGPRGIWIIGLIANGRICFQSDITKLWKIGRSMVTEEVALLTRSMLISTAPDTADRRQIRLVLTAKGKAVNDELGAAFSGAIGEKLASYRPEELELCISLLNDLGGVTAKGNLAGIAAKAD